MGLLDNEEKGTGIYSKKAEIKRNILDPKPYYKELEQRYGQLKESRGGKTISNFGTTLEAGLKKGGKIPRGSIRMKKRAGYPYFDAFGTYKKR